MATFRRESVIEAPLADVWEHQIRPSGLVATTPAFVNLSVAAVRDADGARVEAPSSTPLAPGWEVDVRTEPFGLWRDSWTGHIVDVEGDGDVRSFRDEMRDGPFPHWSHTHTFESLGPDRTRAVDTVRYRLPGPALLDQVATVGLSPLFRYRAWRIVRALE